MLFGWPWSIQGRPGTRYDVIDVFQTITCFLIQNKKERVAHEVNFEVGSIRKFQIRTNTVIKKPFFKVNVQILKPVIYW